MGHEKLTPWGQIYIEESDVREAIPRFPKPTERWREPAVPEKRKPIMIERLEELETGLKQVVVMLGEAPMTHRFKQLNQLYNSLEELSINKSRKAGRYRITELETGMADAVIFLKKSKQTRRYKLLQQVHDDLVELLANRSEEVAQM